MTKTIYMMRHGETLFNTQKRVQGWCDSPLTENGIAQAKLAKDYFAEQEISFDAVYSSTQERAIDTAKIVSDLPVTQIKDLKEMNFGIFEAQPENLLPKFRPEARSFEDLLVPYGGEDILEVGMRVYKAITEIAEETATETLLMVSHGAALWGLISYLDLAFPEGLPFGNCNICEYEYGDDKQLSLKRVIDPINGTEVTLIDD